MKKSTVVVLTVIGAIVILVGGIVAIMKIFFNRIENWEDWIWIG